MLKQELQKYSQELDQHEVNSNEESQESINAAAEPTDKIKQVMELEEEESDFEFEEKESRL